MDESASSPPAELQELLGDVRREADRCFAEGREFDPAPWCRDHPEAAEEIEALVSLRELEAETQSTTEASTREIRLACLRASVLDAVNGGQAPDEGALREEFPELVADVPDVLASMARMQDALSGEELVVMAEDMAEGAGGLGEFRLKRLVELHPLGQIHVACRAGRDEPVELLVLRPFADAAARQRFLERMLETRCLEGPGLVPLESVSEAEGVHFLVWPHPAGISLGRAVERIVLAHGRLGLDCCLPPGRGEEDQARTRADDLWITEGHRETAERLTRRNAHVRAAVHLASRVAHHVSRAHSQGVLHQGLCPRAVVAGPSGDVRVRWFRAARDLGRRVHEDLPLKRFLAPEQVTMDRGSIGWRTDVYGIGAILHFLLRLEPPYWGVGAHAHFLELMRRPLASLRDALPHLPDELVDLVDSCLARNPEKRPPSCAELEERLQGILDRTLQRPLWRRVLGALVPGSR